MDPLSKKLLEALLRKAVRPDGPIGPFVKQTTDKGGMLKRLTDALKRSSGNISKINKIDPSLGSILGGQTVDVAAQAPKSFFGKVKSLPQGIIKRLAGTININPNLFSGSSVTNRLAGNPAVTNLIKGGATPILNNAAVNPYLKGAVGLGKGLVSWPSLLLSELTQYNPYGDSNNPEMYMKGPGSMEHAMQHGGFIPNNMNVVDPELLEREEWERRTRNSPARQSGAFTDDALWERQKHTRDWLAARGR